MLSITKYIYVVLHSETIEVIVQLIKSLTTQVKVLTGIGGISSSCGRGTVATNPQRQSREARIIFIFPKLSQNLDCFNSSSLPLDELLVKDWRMWRGQPGLYTSPILYYTSLLAALLYLAPRGLL